MRNLISITVFLFVCGQLHATSLWTKRGVNQVSMFSDRVASHVGDILTVVIDESTIINQNSQKTTTGTSAINDVITSFVYAGSGFGTHNGVLPSANITSDESFSGAGTVANTNTIDSRVTVVISDVLPNGNMVIEGARKVAASGETQYAVFRGIVRRDDILFDNTVNSSQIANAHVEFLNKGDIANSHKKGWLTKLLDFFNVW